MLRLEGEGRKKKKDKKRRIGTASSPAAPCRAGRCRRELGSRTPAPVRGSQLQAQAASRRAPRSAELGPFLAGGCRGSRAAPAGGRGGPSAAEPPGEGSGRCGAAPASHVEAKRRSPCPPRSPPGRGQSREQGTALSAPVSPPLPEASLGSSRGAGAAKPPRGVPQPGRGAAPEPRRAPSLHAKV